ncbi:MAG: DUF4412 domain-containing protein [Weeksellaceae bacterium]
MKNYRLILMAGIMILPFYGHAQFLKKMKEKAENAVERTILNRTERAAADGTNKGIDEVLNAGDNNNNNKKKNKKDKDQPSDMEMNDTQNDASNEILSGMLGQQSGSRGVANVPDSYEFSYRATMKIKTGNKEEIMVDYYLEPDVTYFGAGFKNQGATSINVMDIAQNMMVIFMEQNGQKIMMAQKSDPKLTEKFEKAREDIDKEYMANMKDIGGRNILGYDCKGYETTTKEGTYRIWITDQTPVGFMGAGMNEDIDLPESMVRMGKNAMVMEMQFAPAKGKKGRLHMLCVDFKKESKTIKKDDYSSMMGF